MLRASLKQITILFTLLLFCSEVGAEYFTIGNYRYTILDAEARTVSIKRDPSISTTTLTTIEIPDEVTNTNTGITYRITKIADGGFDECTKVANELLTIGSNVEEIGTNAFKQCKFRNVVIPASVTSVGTSAFSANSSLRTVTFNASSNITNISANVFDGCKRLHTIILPPKLIELSSGLFKACDSLEILTIPASVHTVKADVFDGKRYKPITITYEGAEAPYLAAAFTNFSAGVAGINVLSSAAKASFGASSTWKTSLGNDENKIKVVPLEVSEAVDNSAMLGHHNTHTADVNLTRTIRHESYNALCLPFALSAEQVTSVFGADCDIEELTSASISDAGIDLQFTKVTSMAAGKPYLVRPKTTTENPGFTNVVLTDEVASTSLTDVDFIGVFSPTAMTANENILLLGAGNTLFPTDDGTLNGLRGYFVLKSSKAQAAAKKQARVVMNSGGGTALEYATHAPNVTKRIINGELIITRGGVQYNACGARVR